LGRHDADITELAQGFLNGHSTMADVADLTSALPFALCRHHRVGQSVSAAVKNCARHGARQLRKVDLDNRVGDGLMRRRLPRQSVLLSRARPSRPCRVSAQIRAWTRPTTRRELNAV